MVKTISEHLVGMKNEVEVYAADPFIVALRFGIAERIKLENRSSLAP